MLVAAHRFEYRQPMIKMEVVIFPMLPFFNIMIACKQSEGFLGMPSKIGQCSIRRGASLVK
jgi:hypothetical protein